MTDIFIYFLHNHLVIVVVDIDMFNRPFKKFMLQSANLGSDIYYKILE